MILGPALRNLHASMRSQLWHSHMILKLTAGIQHLLIKSMLIRRVISQTQNLWIRKILVQVICRMISRILIHHVHTCTNLLHNNNYYLILWTVPNINYN